MIIDDGIIVYFSLFGVASLSVSFIPPHKYHLPVIEGLVSPGDSYKLGIVFIGLVLPFSITVA